MLRKIIVLVLITLIAASPAYALSLKDAKLKGLVGEMSTGYLGIVKSSAEVEALVADINKKRKNKYKQIAKKNGTKLSDVEALAGKQAIEKTAKGLFVKLPSENWKKK